MSAGLLLLIPMRPLEVTVMRSVKPEFPPGLVRREKFPPLRIFKFGGDPYRVRVPDDDALPVSAYIWNFDDEVAVPPIVRSLLISVGEITPEFLCQKLMADELTQVGASVPLL